MASQANSLHTASAFPLLNGRVEVSILQYPGQDTEEKCRVWETAKQRLTNTEIQTKANQNSSHHGEAQEAYLVCDNKYPNAHGGIPYAIQVVDKQFGSSDTRIKGTKEEFDFTAVAFKILIDGKEVVGFEILGSKGHPAQIGHPDSPLSLAFHCTNWAKPGESESSGLTGDAKKAIGAISVEVYLLQLRRNASSSTSLDDDEDEGSDMDEDLGVEKAKGTSEIPAASQDTSRNTPLNDDDKDSATRKERGKKELLPPKVSKGDLSWEEWDEVQKLKLQSSIVWQKTSDSGESNRRNKETKDSTGERKKKRRKKNTLRYDVVSAEDAKVKFSYGTETQLRWKMGADGRREMEHTNPVPDGAAAPGDDIIQDVTPAPKPIVVIDLTGDSSDDEEPVVCFGSEMGRKPKRLKLDASEHTAAVSAFFDFLVKGEIADVKPKTISILREEEIETFEELGIALDELGIPGFKAMNVSGMQFAALKKIVASQQQAAN